MYQADVDCVSFCFTDLFLMTFSTQNKKNRAITLNFQQKSFVHFVEDNAIFIFFHFIHFLLASENSGHFAAQTLVSTRNE